MYKIFIPFVLLTTGLFAKDNFIGAGVQSANLAIKQVNAHRKESGWITGPRIEYRYRHDYCFNAYAEKSWGDLRTFSIQDFWIEGTFGYDLRGQKKAFIPYAGLGYQYFKQFRHLTDVSISTAHPYVPIGFLFEMMILKELSLGFNMKVLLPLRTLDHVGGFPGSYWGLKRKTNLFIEVPIVYHAEIEDRTWDLSFVPYYRSVRFGPTYSTNAAGVGVGITGENNRYLGMRMTLDYAF